MRSARPAGMSTIKRAAVLLPVVLWLAGCAPPGPTAFVTFNIAPDSSCIVMPQSTGNLFYPIGRFDIAPGGSAGSTQCDHPYIVHLLVNSFLRSNSDMTVGRAEPDILQIHSAEVRLTTIKQETIKFDRVMPELPNPFLVNIANSLFPATGTMPSTGVAAIEAIPKAYASQLDKFVGAQILAHIQIYGTTTGDVDINFKPFVYPIEICSKCLTICTSKLTDTVTRKSIVGMTCDDNSGADDRFCFDPGC